jgi:hypothetical protein
LIQPLTKFGPGMSFFYQSFRSERSLLRHLWMSKNVTEHLNTSIDIVASVYQPTSFIRYQLANATNLRSNDWYSACSSFNRQPLTAEVAYSNNRHLTTY